MEEYKKIRLRRVELARLYVDKNWKVLDTNLAGDLDYMCDQVVQLEQENEILREIMFDLEQTAPEEKRWDNIIASKLRRAILVNDDFLLRDIKKDSLEITNSINNDIFVITIQRKFGKTPEQLREEAVDRRIKAETKVENLSKAVREMEKKLAEQQKQIQTLLALRMDTPEVEAKTKEDIQRLIDAVNTLIKNYNKTVFPRELAKLTGSVQTAYREAWNRAAIIESQVRQLTAKVLELKQLLNKKRAGNSKFSKYRKEREREMVARHRPFFGRK